MGETRVPDRSAPHLHGSNLSRRQLNVTHCSLYFGA